MEAQVIKRIKLSSLVHIHQRDDGFTVYWRFKELGPKANDPQSFVGSIGPFSSERLANRVAGPLGDALYDEARKT